MGKLYLCLIGILLPHALTAQNTSMVWAMSYQIGIDFNVSPPVAIATSVFTYEGSASISNANGQLLLYTAGNVLYNRNHQTYAQRFGAAGPANNGTAVVNPALSDNIYLTVINGGTGNSCNLGSASDTMHITLKACGCKVYLPNAFSPNQDGRNDLFAVQTSGSACTGNLRYTLSIYNRLGERIYREADDGQGWNGIYKGKPADAGTYYFYLEYLPVDSTVKGIRKGDLALIR